MFSNIVLLFMINILSSIGYSLIAPLYPAEAAKKGVPEYIIGFTFSCFAISNVMTIPITPSLIKKYGRQRLMYIAMFIEVCSIYNHSLLVLLYLV